MQLAFPIDARMDNHGKRNGHGSFDMSISKEWMIDFHKKNGSPCFPQESESRICVEI